ncbi:hypothetical protein HJG60_007773 [Phyllostomus discolor]|uniref:Uncharacterized protein n=1 Tax=Phyllostomus discolor TaxID=89673 RepID=A0A834ERJ6_9CHIR|nr:hypothetical protein HJG60_007773 [Phyllostomus discolor]
MPGAESTSTVEHPPGPSGHGFLPRGSLPGGPPLPSGLSAHLHNCSGRGRLVQHPAQAVDVGLRAHAHGLLRPKLAWELLRSLTGIVDLQDNLGVLNRGTRNLVRSSPTVWLLLAASRVGTFSR